MAKVIIDGRAFDLDDRQNMLHACLSLGFDLPYFCWHPALGSVGACRQCAVKQFRDENDKTGKLVMACLLPAAEGTRIAIDDPEAQAFRATVIEWLMENHPHDCPVCDEGGECHLQDMTVMTGHDYREYRFKKRTYRNQNLGPCINHEMNRCIQCYRCVRFYRDYAGGRDLDAFAAHDHVYFGRHEDGTLESEFSGNLVEVCPTGVFTDKTLKQHFTRKWDLQTAPSICTHCGLGCNIIAGERYGGLRRILNRYNSEVNDYFICDRGRFGYEFVNAPQRIRQPSVNVRGATARAEKHDNESPGMVATKDEILQRIARDMRSGQVIGIGSPRASLEANYVLRKLVGRDNFCNGMAALEARLVALAIKILREGPARAPSMQEIRQADAVFILGEDLTNTAPMLDLAVRQSVRQKPLQIATALNIPEWHDAAVREAVQDQKGPCFIATVAPTKLDEVASQTYRAAPDDLARLGFAVAHEIDPQAPAVRDLSAEAQAQARDLAQALLAAEKPVVISGTSNGHQAMLQAAANVAWALCRRQKPATLCLTVPECNSLGVALMSETSLEAVFEAVRNGKAETVVILENDLFRRAAADEIDQLLTHARHVVVIDHTTSATTARAETVLPAGTFAESEGTFVSNEGRAQRFFQVMVPAGEIQAGWRWLRDLAIAAGRSDLSAWQSLDQVTAAVAQEFAVFSSIPEVAPPAGFRVADEKIPRQPRRYSGRTAMLANISVHEPKPPTDPDSALAFSMEGFAGQPPSALIPYFWAPAWNSVQSVNKFQSEVGGPLHGGDPGSRLLEPTAEARAPYFSEMPAAFVPRTNEWLVVPRHHIFGSEEMSSQSPAIAQRAPQAHLVLNAEEAARLRLQEGEAVALQLDGEKLRLPVTLNPAQAKGTAGLLTGLREFKGVSLPTWCKLEKIGA